MVMKEARRGAVSPGVFLVDSSVSRRIPTFRLKTGSWSISVELMCLKTMMGDEAAPFERFLLVP